ELATRSDRPRDAKGIALTPLDRRIDGDAVAYSHVALDIDRARGIATVTVRAPANGAPDSVAAAHQQGAAFWPLARARALEDAILNLRANERAMGILIFRAEGDAQNALRHDALLAENDWLMREVRHYFKRVLKRIDVTSRSFIAFIEPGTCFAGTLAELAFA